MSLYSAAYLNEVKRCDRLMGLYVARVSQVAREAATNPQFKGAATALRAELGRDRAALWLEGTGKLDDALLAIEVGFGDWHARAVSYLNDVRDLLTHRATL